MDLPQQSELEAVGSSALEPAPGPSRGIPLSLPASHLQMRMIQLYMTGTTMRLSHQ